MASILQYATSLWNSEKVIARKLGVDIRSASLETRVIVITINAVFAAVIKAITDAGVSTDAALQAQLNSIAAAPLKQQPDAVAPDMETGEFPDPVLLEG